MDEMIFENDGLFGDMTETPRKNLPIFYLLDTSGSMIGEPIAILNRAMTETMEELKNMGINVRVIDMHTIKPIDKDIIIKAAKETKKLITVEDHNIIGGLGSAVCEVLAENYPTKVYRMGIKDEFGKSGKADDLLKYFQIDKSAIINAVTENN